MASTRFPNKPLAKINGIPMLERVYQNSAKSNLIQKVFIATCDQAIVDFAHSINAKVIMTSHKHKRASDRTAEAMLKIEESEGINCNIVVMIQGDEPMVSSAMIDKAIQPLLDNNSVYISNLMEDIQTQNEHEDPNEVKVVTDNSLNALYFSREPIPSRKKGVSNIPMKKQVCIIPFRRDFLIKYNNLPPTPLEIIESVDMNRVLEHGYKIKMVHVEDNTYSVDTEDDRKHVEKLLGHI